MNLFHPKADTGVAWRVCLPLTGLDAAIKTLCDDGDEHGVGSVLSRMVQDSSSFESFQDRVQPWMMACFGEEISRDGTERNHRFFEEATELVQACGMTRSETYQLVDYVFDRPIGEKHQEIGGVMVTLAALCLAHGQDMHECGEIELARIWTMVEKIRDKQAAKPKHSPLPMAVDPVSAVPDGWHESVVAMNEAKQLPVWDGQVPFGLHQRLDIIFRMLANPANARPGSQPKVESKPEPLTLFADPLLVFAQECEMGVYQEDEIPAAARKAMSASKKWKAAQAAQANLSSGTVNDAIQVLARHREDARETADQAFLDGIWHSIQVLEAVKDGCIESRQPDLVSFVADEVRGNVISAIAEAIGGNAYDCTRVWSAWGYGTMSQSDFYPITDDESRLTEIAEAAIAAMERSVQQSINAMDAKTSEV